MSERDLQLEAKYEQDSKLAGTYKIVKEWSAESADWTYKIYIYALPTLGVSLYYYWNCLGEGDVEWAMKNAEHYKIQIEDEER
jgi:hypothetical protein